MRNATLSIATFLSTRRLVRRVGLAAILLTSTALAGPVAAQTSFSSITVFGNSYADSGNYTCFETLGVANCPYPSHITENSPSTVFPTVFPVLLQQLYGIPNSEMFNYAISGATAYNAPPVPGAIGTTAQVNTFIAQGGHFGPQDLVVADFTINDAHNSVSIALNSPSVPTAFDTGNPVVDAKAEVARDVASVQQLVNVGLRNLAILGPGDWALLPIGQHATSVDPTGFLSQPAAQPLFNAYANAAWAAENAELALFAQSGVRIFLFDLTMLEQRLNGIGGTPQMYGFANLNAAFIPDGLHPNTAFALLIAQYMQNQMDATNTVAPQSDVAMASATSFTNAAFGRLDAYRAFSPYVTNPVYPMATKAPPAPENRWSAFFEGNLASGSRDSQFLNSGYNYDDGSGTAGLEYRVNQNLRVGALFGYSNPTVDLGVQNAHLNVNSYQIGGYGSFTERRWFTDALLAYGYHHYDIDRAGIIDTITATTNANTVVAAGRGGYLFDATVFRAGPIAGLNYTRAQVSGYTEQGDVLITQIVAPQTEEALTGSAGVQVRLPFWIGTAAYSPFLNLTVEHDFIGSGRTIETTQVTTPLLPVFSPVDGLGNTYGKVAGGIAASITGNVSAMVNAWSTFARAGGNDYGANGGVKISF